jgi:hypothetical protein
LKFQFLEEVDERFAFSLSSRVLSSLNSALELVVSVKVCT